jgi:hypothetical protein
LTKAFKHLKVGACTLYVRAAGLAGDGKVVTRRFRIF